MRRRHEHGPNHDLRVALAAIATLAGIWLLSELTDYDPPTPTPVPPQTVESERRDDALSGQASRGSGRTEIPLPGAPAPDTSGRPEDAGKRQLSRPIVGHTWRALAACESSGDWQADTGNGYYGGLQFSLQSWRYVGGSGYPHEATMAEQIHRAELLQDVQGWGAWPACAASLGLLP